MTTFSYRDPPAIQLTTSKEMRKISKTLTRQQGSGTTLALGSGVGFDLYEQDAHTAVSGNQSRTHQRREGMIFQTTYTGGPTLW